MSFNGVIRTFTESLGYYATYNTWIKWKMENCLNDKSIFVVRKIILFQFSFIGLD